MSQEQTPSSQASRVEGNERPFRWERKRKRTGDLPRLGSSSRCIANRLDFCLCWGGGFDSRLGISRIEQESAVWTPTGGAVCVGAGEKASQVRSALD